MDKVSSNCVNKNHVDRISCSALPSLAQVLFIVIALMCFILPVVYSLCMLRAQSSVISNLQAEVVDLRSRMNRLEIMYVSATMEQTTADDDEDNNFDDYDLTLPRNYSTEKALGVEREGDETLDVLFDQLDIEVTEDSSGTNFKDDLSDFLV